MSTPSDANKVNPKEFIITPGPAVAGAPVDDLTIEIGTSDVNNTAPASFPISTTVPKADVVVQSDGNWHVPFGDAVTQMLAPGVYGARAEADSGAQQSDPSPVIFFNITPPKPAAPLAIAVS